MRTQGQYDRVLSIGNLEYRQELSGVSSRR
jgi:hypothetical protein